MKLPSLPDLDLEDNLDEFLDEKEKKTIGKRVSQKSVNKKISVGSTKEDKEPQGKEEKRNERPRIPKSKYDNEGNPVLTIPDLDDVDLTSEIDKFFGKGGS